ncbi:recombinase family protein [soil metagenome]
MNEAASSQPLALIYLRVSTSKQATRGGEAEGFSIPAQRAGVLRKASELGATVPADGEYLDAGESARSADRPALQAMLARLLDRSLPKVSFVIVHKVDRLARDRADDVAIGLAIHKAGAVLVSATEAIDDSPAGTLLHGIMASIAEFYSKNLAMEVRKGQTQKAQLGGTPGYVPIGYRNIITRVEGHEVRSVEVDPERTPLVQWAFKAYASGDHSITDLLQEVTQRGLTNRPTATRPGKPLTRSQLHRMLGNQYYIGKVCWAGVEYDGRHEPLIDLQTYARVQAVLGSRRIAGDRSWKNDQYLVGSLRCDRCRDRLGYGESTGKGGTKYRYFFCLGRAKKRTACDLPYLSVEAVERKVVEHWSTIELPVNMAEQIRADLLTLIDERAADSQTLLTTQQKRLTKLERTRQRLIDGYLAEAITASDLKSRQEELLVEQQDAERLLATASQSVTLVQRHLEEALLLMTHCSQAYLRLDDNSKRTMNQVFFNALYLDAHGDVGHSDLQPPFRSIASRADDDQDEEDGNRPHGTHGGSGPLSGDPGSSRVAKVATKPRAHLNAHTKKNTGADNRRRCSNVAILAEREGFEPPGL